jgi:hypothetical protein
LRKHTKKILYSFMSCRTAMHLLYILVLMFPVTSDWFCIFILNLDCQNNPLSGDPSPFYYSVLYCGNWKIPYCPYLFMTGNIISFVEVNQYTRLAKIIPSIKLKCSHHNFLNFPYIWSTTIINERAGSWINLHLVLILLFGKREAKLV